MIGLSGFGFRRKPRTFNSHPMYWDKEAEERKEKRDAALADSAEGEEYAPGSIIRAGRVRRMNSSKKANHKGGSTLIRTLIFLGLLGAVFYILADYISFM